MRYGLFQDDTMTATLTVGPPPLVTLTDDAGRTVTLTFAQLRAVYRAAESALPWQP